VCSDKGIGCKKHLAIHLKTDDVAAGAVAAAQTFGQRMRIEP